MSWRQTAHGREPDDPRMKQICEALRQGESYAAIAERFSISIPRVSQIRKFAEIERRKADRSLTSGAAELGSIPLGLN